MFRNDLIDKVVKRSGRVDQLLQDTKNNPIAHYVFRDYISSDQIPDITLNGVEQKTPARLYFEKHNYLSFFDEASTLEHFTDDSIKEWWSQKLCPYLYTAHFFDTFMVIQVEGSNEARCFLVLSPDSQAPTSAMKGMAESIGITQLYSALSDNPPAQTGLHYKINEILECLRTGLGRKKRFGLF